MTTLENVFQFNNMQDNYISKVVIAGVIKKNQEGIPSVSEVKKNSYLQFLRKRKPRKSKQVFKEMI